MAFNRFSYFGRKPRHPAADPHAAIVRLSRAGGSRAEGAIVDLIDFARNGARLRLADALHPGGFAPGESVIVHLTCKKNPRLVLEVPATVRWQQAQGPGLWLLGCEFHRELPLETLGELFLDEVLSDESASNPKPDV